PQLVRDPRAELAAGAPRGDHDALATRAREAGGRHGAGLRLDGAHSSDSFSTRSAYPSTFSCFGRAIPSAPSGTSSVITDPAPVYAPSPTRTGATKELFTPVLARFPISVRCL